MFIIFYIINNWFKFIYSTFDKCSCNQTLASTINIKQECIYTYSGVKWDDINGDCICDADVANTLSKDECELNPALVYSSPYFRFDDIFSALFSVFLISKVLNGLFFMNHILIMIILI